MEIKTAVIADAANVSQEGKLNILGIFNRITTDKFPTVWPAFVLVVRVEAHQTETGEHDLRIVVANEDGRRLAQVDAKFTVPKPKDPGRPIGTQFIIPVQGATFPEPGVYTFDILIDGRYEDRVSLTLRKR